MNLTHTVKAHILDELRNGNTEVLKGLPPVLAMSYGIALQNECGSVKDPSPIDEKAVNEAVLNRIKDTGIKEQIIKQMKDKEVTGE
ncbi:hypothetical protein [Robertmurraya kyonggiensis]|uniref:Uncharacterized protein n=1 Tax=Robertmurraya kyonggiensis TaxID=1037680 RepID=A0A4U1D7W0_9BACI|nr:hypothetical protein [Robertmurraya kyonggiensis]TKC18178.1 hypothetical protein FA727_01070 [Robertmurraya kyonggiensis]